jgi:NitT/TauT family transport system ATP-binding protein
MADIEIQSISKAYEGKPVLSKFSAVIPGGKTTCIMAPSGRGKTTLLRILMGLERPDAGTVQGLAGKRMSAVFQEDRLIENLSPVANIRLPTPQLRREEALEAMEAVGLADCADQPVRELSGGMCRRVAILRALLAEYDVLLMDEPFKGLDAETKERVIRDARRRCAGRTVILITHDREEADAMGAARILTL